MKTNILLILMLLPTTGLCDGSGEAAAKRYCDAEIRLNQADLEQRREFSTGMSNRSAKYVALDKKKRQISSEQEKASAAYNKATGQYISSGDCAARARSSK